MDSSDLELSVILAALGFAPQQASNLLEQGVTIAQLRGMWQLRQCEGASADVLADIAERINRLEQTEKLPLDSAIA